MQLLGFAAGGILSAVSFALGSSEALTVRSGNIYPDLPLQSYILVCTGMLAGTVILSVGGSFSKTKKYIQISKKRRTVGFYALADSGCMVSDPLTGKNVVIVSPTSVQRLFEKNISEIIMSGRGAEEIIEALAQTEEIKFYLIPFYTVNSNDGMLIAFSPEKLEVNGKKFSGTVGILPGFPDGMGYGGIIGG